MSTKQKVRTRRLRENAEDYLQIKRLDQSREGLTKLTVKGPHGAVTYWCDGEGPNDCGIEVHSKVPFYRGQKPVADWCEQVGGLCYHDGSTLYAREVLQPLLEECGTPAGREPFWQNLKEIYRQKLILRK